MLSPLALLAAYCLLILVASLIGGWMPMAVALTHRRLQVAISFVSGVMLGIGLMHMLPHALTEREAGMAAADTSGHFHVDLHELIGPVMTWMLGGFLLMFFVERFFCFHHHDVPQQKAGEHEHHVGCTHEHGSQGRGAGGGGHRLHWAGAMIGMTVHALIEGVALAAAVTAARHGEHAAALAGFGTFLVIILHKPFDSMTLLTLMTVGKRSLGRRHLVNTLFSLLIPVGAGAFWLGLRVEGADAHFLTSAALALSAGMFLCISLSDLLPELQFHSHDRIKLSIALLAGLGIAWGAAQLEAVGHAH
jgi:zinc and cadmium transporter